MTLTALSGFPTVRPGDNLAALIIASLGENGISAQDGDILVLAQKIVSKSEGRLIYLRDVVPSEEAKALAAKADKDPRVVELILRESKEVLRCRPGVIIVEDKRGLVMANAGIDASNTDIAEEDEAVLLLPEDPDRSAQVLHDELHKQLGLRLGILINDSFGRAWRNGTVGTAIGLAAMPGLWDMRGMPDRNGRILRSTEVGVGDELAAAGSLLMGQGSEGCPVVHVRGFPAPMRNGNARELRRDPRMDLFR